MTVTTAYPTIATDLIGTGTVVLPADALIRRIIATDLRRDPNDGIAYRKIGQILAAIGQTYEAEVCVAGSLMHVIPSDWVDVTSARPKSVDEAVAADEGVRKIPLSIVQPQQPYTPSRSFDGTCPPVLGARMPRSREHFVAEITGGRCVVGNVGYAAFSREGSYLTDFCSNDGRLVAAAEPVSRPPLTQFPGTVLFLAHAYANSNFHWIFETLPRLALLRAAGFDPAQADHILVRPLYPHQIDALERLGVPRHKLIFTSDYTHVAAGRLVLTSNVETYDHSFHPPSIEIEPWICHFIRTAFGFTPVMPAPVGRRIHISRKKAAWRNLVNQDDVNAFLEKNGFQTVYFEDISLEEKFQILHSADVVTGLFGAGFAHLPFCRPGTKAILFYPDECITDSYWMVCEHSRLEHYHLICESARNFFPLSQEGRKFTTLDALVNLNHLQRTLHVAGLTDVSRV